MREAETVTLADENSDLIDLTWKRLGREQKWPVDTVMAFWLVAGLGYEVDKARFMYWLDNGTFIPPGKVHNRYQWTREDVLRLATHCEEKRCWLPLVTRHQHKKTPHELQKEADRFAALVQLDRELQKKSEAELLVELAECDDADMRKMLYNVITSKRSRT